MSSRLLEEENEGLIVIGRRVANEYESDDAVRRLAAAVDEWGAKLSLPLGLVYCGSTINWPDDVEITPIVIGLITFSGYGSDDEPVAGTVEPEAMDIGRAAAIPDELWASLEEDHDVELDGEIDVFLAAAGWTWARLHADDNIVCGASADADGYVAVPTEARGKSHVMRVGYC